MRALTLALLVACSSDWVSRDQAAHEIARALCERAVRCGRVAASAVDACESAQYWAICQENTCDGRAASADRVNACADACRDLGCAETQWPMTCFGATR